MRWLFGLIITGHGLIHVLGFVKAFGLRAVPQLTQPISRPVGALWLLAAALCLSTAALWLLDWRWWWAVAGLALVLSQVLIVLSWSDAKYGTLANVLLLAAVVFAVVTPLGQRAND